MKDVFRDVRERPLSGATLSQARDTSLWGRNHQYAPLDLEHGRQIRILVLKAGKASAPLRCVLEHVNLQQGPVYEALSYTWSDA
jgi:hypothetical protein